MHSLTEMMSESGTDLSEIDGSSIRLYGGGGRWVYGLWRAKVCLRLGGLLEGESVTIKVINDGRKVIFQIPSFWYVFRSEFLGWVLVKIKILGNDCNRLKCSL